MPMRWSVTRFSLKLYVRIFSERSPDPTIDFRSLARASCCFCSSISCRRARRTRMAFSRFLICDFSSCIETTVVLIDLDVHFFRLGKDGDRDRGCMDTAARFGLRDSLDPVDPALEA